MYRVIDFEELTRIADQDVLDEYEGCDSGEFLVKVDSVDGPVEVIAYDGWYYESPEDMMFCRSLGWVVQELNRALNEK